MRAITKRSSTRSIKSAAAPKPRAIIAGSGDFTKLKTASGNEIIGLREGSAFNEAVNPAVRSTGEVSPIPRAVPKMTAVVKPDRAVGNVTCHTVRH